MTRQRGDMVTSRQRHREQREQSLEAVQEARQGVSMGRQRIGVRLIQETTTCLLSRGSLTPSPIRVRAARSMLIQRQTQSSTYQASVNACRAAGVRGVVPATGCGARHALHYWNRRYASTGA